MQPRTLTFRDRLLAEAGHFLQTVWAPARADRPTPQAAPTNPTLSPVETKHSAGLMRVDHTGEICAQALYRGQALVAKQPHTRDALLQAAREENDHLAWCQERLTALNSHTSYLNLLWYSASFKIGVMAGLLGDRFSMGYIIETENQVVRHIDEHLGSLPEADQQSRAILHQMRTDEQHHATMALKHGGIPLPKPIRCLMHLQSKVMTKTAYYW